MTVSDPSQIDIPMTAALQKSLSSQ